MHSSCPSQAKLTALLKGELPDASRGALKHHLKSCPACRQRLEWMATGEGSRLGRAGTPQRGPGRGPQNVQPVEDRKPPERGEPHQAHKETILQRIWWWCRGKPALTRGVLVILALVVILGGVTWKWRGQARQRELAERASRRAEQARTHLEIEKSLRSGDAARGLATLAFLVRQQPANPIAVERLMNALSYRSFCVPVAALEHSRGAGASAPPEGPLTAVNFSVDGRWLATAGSDGKARVWDGQTGQLVHALPHEESVLWAQFSVDGTRLVTASRDRRARIWEVAGGQLVVPPLQHPELVWFAAFSPEGARLVTASEDGKARIWEVATGKLAGEPLNHDGRLVFACFSPDGRYILTAEGSPPNHKAAAERAWIWDAATGKMLHSLPYQGRAESRNRLPAFSPSGDRVLIQDNLDALIFPIAGESQPIRLAHDQAVLAQAFAPDGQRVATGSADGMARIWRLKDSRGEAVLPPLAHQPSVISIQFIAEGAELVTGSSDHSARLWDVATGRALSEPLRHETAVRAALVETNHHRMVTVSGSETAWLWDVRSGETRSAGSAESGGVNHARFSGDGRIVAALSAAGISVLDGRTGWPLREPITWKAESGPGPGSPAAAASQAAGHEFVQMDLSANGRYVAAALADGRAMVWEVFGTNARPLASSGNASIPAPLIRCLRFSPDSRRLAIGADDGRTMMWQVDSGQLLFELERHKARVDQVEISSDGKQLLTVSRDRTVRLWDASTGKVLLPPLEHESELKWAGFDPTGERIATVTLDQRVRLWSPRTGDLLVHPLVHAEALAELHPAHFSPDGGRLATAAGDALQVWDVRTGESVVGPLRLNGRIVSVRFSPNGKRLVTASEDGNAYVWDASTGYPLSDPLQHTGRVTYAEYSPDGSRIATSSLDRWVRLWPVIRAPVPAPGWLAELAEALAGQRLDERNQSEVVPVRQLFELRQKLHANRNPGYYAGWARWFFADSQERPSVDLFEPSAMPISQEVQIGQ